MACTQLSSAHGPSEVDRSYKPAICVPMNALPFGHRRAGGEVVVRPACEHNDLEAVGLLGKQCAEPVHPRIVALDELIVENDKTIGKKGRGQFVRRGTFAL